MTRFPLRAYPKKPGFFAWHYTTSKHSPQSRDEGRLKDTYLNFRRYELSAIALCESSQREGSSLVRATEEGTQQGEISVGEDVELGGERGAPQEQHSNSDSGNSPGPNSCPITHQQQPLGESLICLRLNLFISEMG